MRIKNFDIGVERISKWNVGDEFHLPDDGKAAPAFLPAPRPLDDILLRPSLDERLPDMLQPARVDPDLLHPAVLTGVRQGLARFFSEKAATAAEGSAIFAAAAGVLRADDHMDAEVRAALAMLLRG